VKAGWKQREVNTFVGLSFHLWVKLIIEWCDVNPATPILDDSDDDSNNDVDDVH
jgi:hypothetical protein